MFTNLVLWVMSFPFLLVVDMVLGFFSLLIGSFYNFMETQVISEEDERAKAAHNGAELQKIMFAFMGSIIWIIVLWTLRLQGTI